MKLADCLKEGQPELALIHKEDWMENKCLLRYGNKLEIVTAWNLKEDFIPTVEDFFADDWNIYSSFDMWLRAGNKKRDEIINKRHDDKAAYAVVLHSHCEYTGSIEAHSIKEAYQLICKIWENDIRPLNDSGNFELPENILDEVLISEGDESWHSFNVNEEDWPQEWPAEDEEGDEEGDEND